MFRSNHRRTMARGIAALLVTLWLAAPAAAALVVPAYSSLPGAHAKLYLDFGGATVPTWGSYAPGTVPAYDTNGNSGSFSAGELANIRQIYLRVAEKYSPFNVNVTTVDPGNLTNKETARIIVSGNGSWYGSVAGGVAYRGGFTSGLSNIGWAFPAHLSNGNPKTVAECIAHEAGHLFGLHHQSSWSQNAEGTWVKNEYSTNNNDALRRPVMGSSYGSARGLWWNGTTTSRTTIQDDVAVLSNTTNAFGYRADDHANVFSEATSLVADPSGNIFGSGIITRTSDMDLFSFFTGTGRIQISTVVAEFGAMLDSTLRLFTTDGMLLQTTETFNLGETLATSLPAGQYVVGVSSRGNYGDIGQYSLLGTVVPVPEPTLAWAGVAALLLLCGRRSRR